MSELVEDRFHLAMSQQRRLLAYGWRQIAANQAQVRLVRIDRRYARNKRVHPRAAALVLARIPVRVERADPLARLVLDDVILHRLVPRRNAGALADSNAQH